MKITIIACIIIYISVVKLHSQNNNIYTKIFLPKISYGVTEYKNFWYFSDKFKADTLLLSSVVGITVNSNDLSQKGNWIPVCFTGYLDIEYKNNIYATICYQKFSAIFREKIIDSDKSNEPYGGIFRTFGLVICLHKTKPLIRLYRFTGAGQNKHFFRQLTNQLKKKNEFSAFYAIPGGRDDSNGCIEIIIK